MTYKWKPADDVQILLDRARVLREERDEARNALTQACARLRLRVMPGSNFTDDLNDTRFLERYHA